MHNIPVFQLSTLLEEQQIYEILSKKNSKKREVFTLSKGSKNINSRTSKITLPTKQVFLKSRLISGKLCANLQVNIVVFMAFNIEYCFEIYYLQV
jgi:hypothetical protein